MSGEESPGRGRQEVKREEAGSKAFGELAKRRGDYRYEEVIFREMGFSGSR